MKTWKMKNVTACFHAWRLHVEQKKHRRSKRENKGNNGDDAAGYIDAVGNHVDRRSVGFENDHHRQRSGRGANLFVDSSARAGRARGKGEAGNESGGDEMIDFQKFRALQRAYRALQSRNHTLSSEFIAQFKASMPANKQVCLLAYVCKHVPIRV